MQIFETISGIIALPGLMMVVQYHTSFQAQQIQIKSLGFFFSFFFNKYIKKVFIFIEKHFHQAP